MSNEFKENSMAVQAHLTISQDVIQRMAANCNSCKAWCITLVSAILVAIADKNKPNLSLIAAIPAVLFLVLDAYYLALETMFRKSYNLFITKLHKGAIIADDLFVIRPTGSTFPEFLAALTSISIWPFYLTLLAVIALATVLLSP